MDRGDDVMTRGRALHHAVAGAALVIATLFAGGVTATVPADASAQDVVVGQRYSADSGDKCPMGSTKGTLGWQLGTPRAVGVTGAVADRPVPNDPDQACGDDGRYTTATFTAYTEGTAVASIIQRADNGQRDISFSLISRHPIDLVVVQVCRISVPAGPAGYCGTPQRYPAPVTQRTDTPVRHTVETPFDLGYKARS